MRLWIVIAIALLASFAGFALAVALRVSVPGADAGDWLTAGAGAAGVMLTVLAAVGIEEYRASWRVRKGRTRLATVLDELYRATLAAQRSPEWSGGDDEHRGVLRNQQWLLTAIARYRFVREKAEIEDLNLWTALQDLDAVLAEQEPILEREHGLLSEHKGSEDVYRINSRMVFASCTDLWQVVAMAQHRARLAR